jgi:hypothetical protein
MNKDKLTFTKGKLANAAYGGGIKAVWNLAKKNDELGTLAKKTIEILESAENVSLNEAVDRILMNY